MDSSRLNNYKSPFFWFSSTPLFGGTLLVGEPLVRMPMQTAVAIPGATTCAGFYSQRFTQAYMAIFGLGPGAGIHGQWYSRDPGFPAPNDVGLTNIGLELKSVVEQFREQVQNLE